MHTQMTLDLDIEERVDVRSLIVHGDIERDAPKAKREQPAPEWERVLSDGADCAFRRRLGNRSPNRAVTPVSSWISRMAVSGSSSSASPLPFGSDQSS